jgi:hypothetical protein
MCGVRDQSRTPHCKLEDSKRDDGLQGYQPVSRNGAIHARADATQFGDLSSEASLGCSLNEANVR